MWILIPAMSSTHNVCLESLIESNQFTIKGEIKSLNARFDASNQIKTVSEQQTSQNESSKGSICLP